MTTLREQLDTALFPIERPDFFINAAEYYDVIEKTVRNWLLDNDACRNPCKYKDERANICSADDKTRQECDIIHCFVEKLLTQLQYKEAQTT